MWQLHFLTLKKQLSIGIPAQKSKCCGHGLDVSAKVSFFDGEFSLISHHSRVSQTL
mgnify:CR=1 FL=1